MEINDEERRELEEKLKGMSPEELKEFQEQQCIFCQIIAGKVPSKKVYEDDKCIAIMDINPAAIGHVLLLPKEHYMIMPQIPEETLGWLFMAAKHLSQAMLRRFKVEGTNIFVANGPVAGQRAQHFMVHIIPRKEGDGILEIPEHLVEEEVRKRLGGVIKEKANVHKKVELFWHPENPPKADFHDFAGKKKEVRGKGEGERGKGGEGRALK